MKKSLLLLKIFLVISISVSAQELLREGEVYVNDTTDVFILTPSQAQQIIYWQQDSKALPHVIDQYMVADSLNSLYLEKIVLLEEEVEYLYDQALDCPSLSFGKSLKWGVGGALIGVIIGLIIN